jgi:hypothetical protein
MAMEMILNAESPIRSQITSLYRPSRRNVGSRHSAPAQYFSTLNSHTINILPIKKGTILINAHVIIGGGGMFTPKNANHFKLMQLAQLGEWWVGAFVKTGISKHIGPKNDHLNFLIGHDSLIFWGCATGTMACRHAGLYMSLRLNAEYIKINEYD